MSASRSEPVRLIDYRAPDYLIDRIDLVISLHPTQTLVRSRVEIRPNPAGRPGAPLVLDGDGLHLQSLLLNNEPFEQFVATPDDLTIAQPPDAAFSLTIETMVDPSANTQLSGLYRSASAYCTQCEAEGFRRITYFLDRPDVLSVYTLRIEADRAEAPVLLGNGNPVSSGALPGGSRHFAVWHDPFPKPCYLFALVAGDLGALTDSFRTMSGRLVDLAIHVEKGKEAFAAYAMDSLKRAMRWDETTFGREYDLDVFNIVAVPDFNMGAMENKGLNIFNDKYILASPETATDTDYEHIESIVAHEYFHNWTGNRITCRDWFQLCLKEGLTVFRDQEFSADQRSRAAQRINDVRALRLAQFSEDAGPLAHNVRPDSYLEINNFYTPTVYEKGAEVIRVLRRLIGDDDFAKGMQLYFARHDGTAATVEQFIACFAEASDKNLTAFMRWYTQAGTPVLSVTSSYNADAQTLSLELSQSTMPTPGQPVKEPQVLPVSLGLLKADGLQMPLVCEADAPTGASGDEVARSTFVLATNARTIIFRNIRERPVVSLLRGFSAPVRLKTDIIDNDLARLMMHDADPFNRWEASQTLAMRILTRKVTQAQTDELAEDLFAQAWERLIADARSDPELTSQILILPGEADIARELGADIDPDAIHRARKALKSQLGLRFCEPILRLREQLTVTADWSPESPQAALRALRNTLLDLHACANPAQGGDLALDQLQSSNNMTDTIAALQILSLIPDARRDKALAFIFEKFSLEHLVIDKWFAVQAAIPEPQTLARVRSLMSHPAFSMRNPNRLRSLIGAFANANPTQFNSPGGAGYDLVVGIVAELDSINAQVAARLLGAFRNWRSLEIGRRACADRSLRSLALKPDLSTDVRDILSRTLS